MQEIRDAIEEAYYRDVSPDVLTQPTISLILESLGDPHTAYLSPERYERLQERISSRYSGVGLTVSRSNGGLAVTSSHGGPAHEAGIRPGDTIVSIDGRPASRLDFSRALGMIRGEAGTIVDLTIRRPGSPEPLSFSVVRSNVPLAPVRSRLIRSQERRIAYVRVLSFSLDVSDRVERAVERLSEKGADAILLDLRGNPGGLLTEAIDVTSLFLESGLVCSVEGENQEHREFAVTGRSIDTERPLAVLVDENTASAAEVVAAALHDHGRAELVGLRTFGKSTVQALYPLSNGAALRLTTASYRTPAGDAIGGSGLVPAHEAANDIRTHQDEALIAAQRVLLEGH